MSQRKRILIVGGVAGGASCAARARRLDETAEIIIFDRGPFIAFANCGLPYYVGNVIQEEKELLVASPKLFRQRFNIEVRTENEVTVIDRSRREIEARELKTERVYREPYDTLVLSPGAAPIRPPLPGIDLPGIFVLRTIPDSRRIKGWLEARTPRRAVIVGAGFIGLEMAENLAHRGLKVTIVEMLPQVMPALDPEMAEPVGRHLETQRVDLRLGDGVAGFETGSEGNLVVRTQSDARIPADLVILSIGIRPETTLAKAAGLEIGQRGGIRVDECMRTSDPNIWAVGDAVEVRDAVTGEWCTVPLAGPANRQGRVAADSICGRDTKFRGVQATAVCGFFGMTVALTGATEKALRRAGLPGYEVVYLHPGNHAGYYPGAKPLHMKLLFARQDGRILGAQAVGQEGVEKRIDVISMAMQKQATVFDLEECELCYAPQFGAAKDPVNLAGMAASNVLRGDLSLAPWSDLPQTKALIVDVRDPHEFAAGHIEGAINLPLGELRKRVNELPRDREIWVNCAVGQRSYYALRFLVQNGFNVRNLSGGYLTYWGLYP
jgi:NADPH-dependent 2,4-dienoyl-CoA reductase/sulfur reductase-like enzyme/rhodanese-related sulfurtransferase